MEYSIFQINQVFSCFKFFWNIPYSKKFKIFYVSSFFGISHNLYFPQKLNLAWKICFLNIPVIFHIPKISIFPLLKVFFGIFLEYSIFQIFQYFLVEGLFWNIPFLRFSYSVEYFMEYSLSHMSLFYGGVKFNQG